MGMSASQMRYVMISGKKSDVEYQGQQINQQRTNLATQSSALNTQLLGMSVPTPPSSSDFTRTVYTFSNGAGYDSCSINNVKANTDGTWTISYNTSYTGSDAEIAGNVGFKSETASGNTVYKTLTNTGAAGYTLTKIGDLDKDSDEYQSAITAVGLINKNYSKGADVDKYYSYKDSTGKIRYIDDTSLLANATANNVALAAKKPASTTATYVINDDATLTSENVTMNATDVQYTESNRMSSFTSEDGKKYDLTVTTEKDDDAYNDAMNEYEYQKGQYEQEMENINAKIEIIQSDDKRLELKLQDLDTQQSALSTEMDAVKKVVDKNVETSFKTFA